MDRLGVRTGLCFRPEAPPESLTTAAVECEKAGFDELWVWEDPYLLGGLTTACGALSATDTLRVGVGLLPVGLRNPVLTAMEIATVTRLWPGRFMAALGHGVDGWPHPPGRDVQSKMGLLEEYSTAVLSLLRGDVVTANGQYVELKAARLRWPSSEAAEALVIGGRGPKTLRLGARLSSGVLLDSYLSSEDVRRCRQVVDEVDPRTDITVYVAVDADVKPSTLRPTMERAFGDFAAAGANCVAFQPSDRHPETRAIVEAYAQIVHR